MSYKVKSMQSVAESINDLTFTDYFYRLSLIAKSVFKWNNLPNGIDEKWVEKYLFEDGKCMFFKDETKGFIVTKATPVGRLNYYEEPTKLRPYSVNYRGKTKKNNVDCILIRNNDLMMPTVNTINLYAYRLAEITRTIDVNVSAQKTPMVILCSEKQRLSLKKVFEKVKDNEVAIFGDKTLDIDSIKTLNTEAPVVFPALQVQKHAIWNEAMSFLGINNANQEKKERLVESEVSANNEQVEIAATVMLKARERACKLINEMFGTNISVEMRIDDLKKLAEEIDPEELKEGEE